MLTELDIIIRLLSAAFLGAMIGYEREKYNKPAGLRTNMLVCIGTALMIVYSETAFPIPDSSARVAAGIITGIGFLGAGTIMRSTKRIRGLTTAASLWCVAVIGMAIGAGQIFEAFFATLLVFCVLHFVRTEEKTVHMELPSVKWTPLRYLSMINEFKSHTIYPDKLKTKKILNKKQN